MLENRGETLASLGTKMDSVLLQLKKMEERAYEDHDRIMYLESGHGENKRRIGELEKKSVVRAWEARLEALLVAALATFGIVK